MITPQEVFFRLVEIIYAPKNFPGMIWIMIPLVIAILLMEFYFGRYKAEELGWNTAFGNSLVLIFVAVDLFRHLSEVNALYFGLKAAVALSVVFLGVLLTSMQFFHVLPKELAYGVSDKFSINVIAYLAVILVYSDIPIDWVTALAVIIFSVGLYLIAGLIHYLIPTVLEEVPGPENEGE